MFFKNVKTGHFYITRFFFLNERLSILTHTKNILLWVWILLTQEKKILTKIFWLADCLCHAILFFNSSLPSMMEKVFSSETDAAAFCIGVTADTFSVVTMLCGKSHVHPSCSLFSCHYCTFYLGCHQNGRAVLLVSSLTLFSLRMSKVPCSAIFLSVNPDMWFWDQQHLAESHIIGCKRGI